MANYQYIFQTYRLGKVVPPSRHVLKDISLSFFPDAKIGILGLNGAGKSSLLRIFAQVDHDFIGEARPAESVLADPGLAFVSPKTGRAVSTEAAGPWRERLLPLPGFLAAGRAADSPATASEAVAQGLMLTGHFLVRHVLEPQGKPMPAARVRLDERIAASLLRLVAD